MSSGVAGVTGTGAVVLALVVSLAGALVDIATGPGLRTVAAVCFLAGCLAAALVVRKRDLRVVAVMPPLVFAATALVGAIAEGGQSSGSFLVKHAMDLFTALVVGAPVLVIGTITTLAVALSRGLLQTLRPATRTA